MERKINKKALIISLLFAIVCCALIYTYVGNMAKPEEVKSQAKILVATRNINAGEEIKAADINTIDVSADSQPAGILNDRKLIEGYYAKEPVIMGEPFRGERLAKREEMSLSFNIPEGMRAFTVFVSENTIFSNQLKIGDKVDVVGNFTKKSPDGTVEGDQISKIVLQNIEVLAIGPSRINKVTGKAGNDTPEDGKYPATITLSLKPDDVEKMAFITASASYTLALRGEKDDKLTNTSGVMLQNLAP